MAHSSRMGSGSNSGLSPILTLLQRELAGASLEKTLDLPPGSVSDQLWQQSVLSRELPQARNTILAHWVEEAWVLAGGDGDAFPRQLSTIFDFIQYVAGPFSEGVAEQQDPDGGYGPGIEASIEDWDAETSPYLTLMMMAKLPASSDVLAVLYREATMGIMRIEQGRALDHAMQAHNVTQPEVRSIVEVITRLRTATLFELGATLGAVCAGAEAERVQELRSFGHKVGVGMQMLDDLSSLLRPAPSEFVLADERRARLTWPWVWLSERVSASAYDAMQIMQHGVYEGTFDGMELHDLMRECVSGVGFDHVSDYLQRTFAEFEPHRTTPRIQSEVERWMQTLR